MASFDSIIARAVSLGYPIAKNEFVITKKNPAPTLPFIVYVSQETQSGHDMKNCIKRTEAIIELYTDRTPDEAVEAEIEKRVLYDVEFDKLQTIIHDENMVQTAYEFIIVEKF